MGMTMQQSEQTAIHPSVHLGERLEKDSFTTAVEVVLSVIRKTPLIRGNEKRMPATHPSISLFFATETPSSILVNAPEVSG
jgi:hypothetical protein